MCVREGEFVSNSCKSGDSSSQITIDNVICLGCTLVSANEEAGSQAASFDSPNIHTRQLMVVKITRDLVTHLIPTNPPSVLEGEPQLMKRRSVCVCACSF